MGIRNIVLVFFLLTYGLGYSQNRIKVVLPQNIYTKSEKINLIVFPLDQNITKLPITVSIISCLSKNTISQYLLYADIHSKIYEIGVPSQLEEGSYIIKTSILAETENKIVEDHAHIFHLLENGISNRYYSFKDNQYQIEDKSGNSIKNIHLREGLNQLATSSNLKFSIDEKFLFKPSYINYFKEGKVDTVHRYFYPNIEVNNLYAFYPGNRKTIKLTQSSNANNNYLTVNDFDNQGFYIFDTFKSKIADAKQQNITQENEKYEVVLLDKTDVEFINSLSESAIITERITYLIEDNIPLPQATDVEVLSDNTYNLAEFPEFESVILFIKEVVYPAKIVKSKIKTAGREIILLSGINKKWYNDKAQLIINGVPQNDHEALLQMNWKDISTVRLYRKIETLKSYYGAMGRNGVIEITTKNATIPPNLSTPIFLQPKMVNERIKADSKPIFRPLQSIGQQEELTHGDRTGTFNLFEINGDDVILKSKYTVKL
jgi:hypothetical protein